MADRFAEPDDAAVDELKRKARRRLVGAVVLALAAAVIVPMLLEREPRPLGDEVSVQIPPVDDGKFVNRLTEPKPGTAKSAASSASQADAAPAKSIADAEHRVLAAPPAAPASTAIPANEKAGANAAKPDADASAAVAKAEPPKSEAPKAEAAKAQPAKAKAEPTKTEATKTEPPKQANVPAAAPAVSSATASGQGFVVQLAAFADDKGANALTGKLKRAGYPAYTEPVQTTHGTLWRVRVGSYPSRDAATDARNKLKGDGYNGMVATVK